MEKLLFFDIETHRVRDWKDLPSILQKAFETTIFLDFDFATIEECFREKAGLNAEFSQVICISMGYECEQEFKLRSICSLDESAILTQFADMLEQFHKRGYSLAGHNIIGFDIPFLIKRYIINRMKIPDLLKGYDGKPWERPVVDTIQEWKFGGWQNVSLEVICSSLGVKCKSSKLTGKTMYRYDISEINLDELQTYCEEDVNSNYEIYKLIQESL